MWLTKTRLFKHIEKFTSKNFSDKNLWYFFHISAQNIDWGYSLEPNNLCFWVEIRKIIYTPVNPSFTVWKWGLRGSKLYRHAFMMMLIWSIDYTCKRLWSLRKHAYSNILKILPSKKGKFSDKNSDIFSYFCSKHRLWVLVRTALTRWF